MTDLSDQTDQTDQSDPIDPTDQNSRSRNYRFETVLDFVAPLAGLLSLITLAEGAFAG
jgi:hypothetical protein